MDHHNTSEPHAMADLQPEQTHRDNMYEQKKVGRKLYTLHMNMLLCSYCTYIYSCRCSVLIHSTFTVQCNSQLCSKCVVYIRMYCSSSKLPYNILHGSPCSTLWRDVWNTEATRSSFHHTQWQESEPRKYRGFRQHEDPDKEANTLTCDTVHTHVTLYIHMYLYLYTCSFQLFHPSHCSGTVSMLQGNQVIEYFLYEHTYYGQCV